MTLMGMTGFGRADGSADWGRWSWEARSVNGKSLDVRFHGPSGLDAVEQAVRELVKARLARGNVQVQLQLNMKDAAGVIRIDTGLLTRLARRSRIMVRNGSASPAGFDGLLNQRGVIQSSVGQSQQISVSDEQKEALIASFASVLDDLETARRREGAALEPVLTAQLDRLRELTVAAEQQAALQPSAVRERFETRLAELLGDGSGIPQDRIVQEAAVLAGKADIREELDRLSAHVGTAFDLVSSQGSKGRKLDFLCQELNREANTLCSKSALLALTNIGLEMKTVIEQFREQVQNVE